MDNATITIAIAETREAVAKIDGDIVSRLRAAMEEAKDHWLVTTDEERFKVAVGGVMSYYGEDSQEYERLKREMKSLSRFSAAIGASQAGVDVNMLSLLSEMAEEAEEYEPIGLLNLWREVKKGIGRRYRQRPTEVTAIQLTSPPIHRVNTGKPW